MEVHRRSLCKECKREWVTPIANYANSSPVTITGNPITLANCPICGSPEVDIIEYKPDYEGLDIPRDEPGRFKVIPYHTVGMADVPNPQITKVLGERKPKDFIVPSLVIEKAVEKVDPIKVPEERSLPIKVIEVEKGSVYDLSDMD